MFNHKFKSDSVSAEVEKILATEARIPLHGHPYHKKTDAELRYIQKDAHQAAQAMKGHDDKAEAKYLDQVNDASTVLYHRKQGGVRQEEVEQIDLDETIRKIGSQYRLISGKGKNLGTSPTEAGAEKREREVEYFKHKKD